jgi:hypothetical protein
MKNNKIQKMILAVVLCSAISFVNESKGADDNLLSFKSAAGIGATLGGTVLVAQATLVNSIGIAKKIKNGDEVTREEASLLGTFMIIGGVLFYKGISIVSKINKL